MNTFAKVAGGTLAGLVLGVGLSVFPLTGQQQQTIRIITIDANGAAQPGRQAVDADKHESVRWQTAGAEDWLIIFGEDTPFDVWSFFVPRGGQSVVLELKEDVKVKEGGYKYSTYTRENGKLVEKKDPFIDVVR